MIDSKRKRIRNFCIIAHIDHGKSTLADRFLEASLAFNKRGFRDQMLDNMDLERERGITIKAKAVRLEYRLDNGHTYIFNLVDTPGHVDFGYEVAKSLRAADGAILLVDATQGVEAQTVVNFHLAQDLGLKIIPVLNKIDLSQVQIERSKEQLREIFGFKDEDMFLVSAKEGTGLKDILKAVIDKVPCPEGEPDEPLRGFLFDSGFDNYKGVALFVRIFEGNIKKGQSISLVEKDASYSVEEICIVTSDKVEKRDNLQAGEIGVLYCGIKDPHEIDIPDYIIDKNNLTKKEIPPCKKLPPMVFSGIFPAAPKDYTSLRTAMEKLRLSDPSFVYASDNSPVLGYGFRCGFLGLLHMEIIQARIEREYDLDVVITSPNVKYQVLTKAGEEIFIENPQKFPEAVQIDKIKEPFVKAQVITPFEFMDPLCNFAKSKRGSIGDMDYLGKDRLNIAFELPFGEIVVDFYDKIKSITKGYGSLDYEFIGFRDSDIVKVEIMFNNKPSGVFSLLLHREKAEQYSRAVILKLKELIPRHAFEINIQAAIGSKVIASEKKPALKKDVTSKCYGGDITRKRKLWEKQKAGKKKLKQLGNVQIPSKAFLEVLKI